MKYRAHNIDMEETKVDYVNLLECAAEGALTNVQLYLLDALDVEIDADMAEKIEANSRRQVSNIKELFLSFISK